MSQREGVAIDSGPLAGLRIVAVEQYGAGPLGSLFLSDLGAEVIKIEDPRVGGDISRYVPPGQTGTDSLFFEAFNRNKRSLVLDLKSDAGRLVFERLVRSADAVYSNLRGDEPERLRIRYRDLGNLNPAIICVALTGYGSTGADATLPGYDAVIQAESGWAALTGEPDGPPTKSGLSLVDYVGGLTAALGLLAGVIDARRTGIGRDISTNLYDAALSMLTYPATWYLSAGFEAKRRSLSAHPSIAPFQFFRSADGFLAVACPKDKFFVTLVRLIGLPDLENDQRFIDIASRARHQDELGAILSERFIRRTNPEWLALLRGRVPVAAVRSLGEALDVSDLAQRGMLAEYDHETLGHVRSVGLPLFVSDYQPTYAPAPRLGADGPAVLTDLGFNAAEIEDMARRGAFG